jgi:hypothetical protein
MRPQIKNRKTRSAEFRKTYAGVCNGIGRFSVEPVHSPPPVLHHSYELMLAASVAFKQLNHVPLVGILPPVSGFDRKESGDFQAFRFYFWAKRIRISRSIFFGNTLRMAGNIRYAALILPCGLS